MKETCFFCKWNKSDADCNQTKPCKNFEYNGLKPNVETDDIPKTKTKEYQKLK